MSKRYVSNLIPEEHRVLKHYFKGQSYSYSKDNDFIVILSWGLGIFSFLAALKWIGHPILFFLFVILGFSITPAGYKFLEKKLRFRFTTKIKGAFAALIIILALPLTSYYGHIDQIEADQKEREQELTLLRIQHEQDSIQFKELQFRDSLDSYIVSSKALLGKQKFDEAIDKLNGAKAFAIHTEEKGEVILLQKAILEKKVSLMVQAGKYKQAIPQLNDLIRDDKNNKNLFYQRALCFSNTGNIQQAVADCKTSIGLGNIQAEKLHDKINPLKRKILYYVTRCCDGTTSGAKGRGACSHHDGVCDWNEPVYQEFRKY